MGFRVAWGRLVAAGILLTSVALGGAPAAQAAPPALRPLLWGSCTDPGLIQAGLQCGFVTVPLDYAHPRAASVRLAVSRLPHTAPADQYKGVVVVNPGGPGGSGLGLAAMGSYIANGVGADYDWIGFDPRGVGDSRPRLTCQPNRLGPYRPDYVPTSDTKLRRWLKRSRRYARACYRAQPALLHHIHTADQARDIDSIRQALGVKQINYYGYSFGTYLGSVYNTLFPRRMARAVFDSNVDPRYVWYQVQLNQDLAEMHSLRLFWTFVAQHNDVYGLGRDEQTVEAHYYDLRASLKAHPAAGTVGPDELDDTFDEAAYDPQYWWPYLAEDWSNYVRHGDTYYLVEDYKIADGPGDDNLYAVYNATQCTDTQWPNLRRQLADTYRIQPAASFYTWTNFWFNAPCLYWKVPASTPANLRGGSLAPLLLDDYSDGPTPYSGDLEVRHLYPNGRLVAAPGSNHGVGVFYGNTCIDDAIAAYLDTGSLPDRTAGNAADATCPAMPTPVVATYPGTPSVSTATARATLRNATGAPRPSPSRPRT